jgi:hypothetical protein
LLLPVKIRRILMKKILVLLLVLAAAGGVFAQQGVWTLGGNVRVGTEVNLNQSPATVGAGNQTPETDGNWDNRAQLNIGYTLGNLATQIAFQLEQQGAGNESPNRIAIQMDYNAGNYRAFASSTLFNVFGPPPSPAAYGSLINQLWGNYQLLNNMILLEAAYKGRSAVYWESDTTYGQGWASLGDRGNTEGGLLADVTLSQLEFGIIVPKIFEMGVNNLASGTTSALLNSVFGFKFTMAPVVFAAQFRFQNYGVYFGGTYTAGPVVIGLNFRGLMDNGPLGAGASVAYNAGVFTAGVNFKYQLKVAKWMEINPYFTYSVIPNYFFFRTDLGFHFEGGDVLWEIKPQIAWNFLGNGTNTYNNLATAFGARYNLVSGTTNSVGKAKTSELWVGFKWGF